MQHFGYVVYFFSGNRVAINFFCVKLETTWGPFVVFGRFSVWAKTVAIIIYNV